MKRRGRFSQWLKERFYSVLDELIVAAIIAAIGYIWAVLTGRLPGISLPWFGGISLTLILVIVVAVALAIVGFVLWRRWRRKRIEPIRPIITVPKDFVGREEEITWLQEMLQGNTAERIMSIYGAPGIGKSWLVNRLAKECQDAGAVWATIDFREASYEPLTFLNAIQRQLGEEYFVSFSDKLQEYIEFRAQQQREYPSLDDMSKTVLLQKKKDEAVGKFLECLAQLVKEKQMILLFDTFERVQDTALANFLREKLLAEVKDGSLPNLMAVVAGWNRLIWRDGWERVISPHELRYFSVEEIKPRLAIEIRIEMEAVDGELAMAVLDYTKGHPLCVGLAAILIAESVKRGERVSKEMFPVLKGELDERMRTELLMKRVWERLDKGVVEAVWLCAVPRWFDAGMIRTLKEVEDGSQALLDKIIQYRCFVKPHSPSGYEYHEIVRQLLLDKWQRDDPAQYIELNERAAKFYEKRLQKIEQTGRKFSEEWQRLMLERVYHRLRLNRKEGLRLFDKEFDLAWRLDRVDYCNGLAGLLEEYAVEDEIVNWANYAKAMLLRTTTKGKRRAEQVFSKLYGNPEIEGTTLQARIASHLGWRCLELGEHSKALRYYDKMQKISEGVGGRNAEAIAFQGMGEVYESMGYSETALEMMRRALEVATSDYMKGAIFHRMGIIYRRAGRITEAIESFEEYDKLEVKGKEVENLVALGDAYRFADMWDMAFARYKKSMAVLRSEWAEEKLPKYIHPRELLAQSTFALGRVYLERGDLEEAKRRFEYAVKVFCEAKNDFLLEVVTSLLGRVYQAQGRWEEAEQRYLESYRLARGQNRLRHAAEALVLLCDMHTAKGTPAEMPRYAEEAERLSREYGYWDQLAKLWLIQASVLLDEEKSEEAFTKYAEAMTFALHFNRYLLDETVENIIGKAKGVVEKGQVEAARALIERLIEFWQTGTLDGKPIMGAESEGREREKGDGKPQTMVIEQLERWLRTLEGKSNSNNRC